MENEAKVAIIILNWNGFSDTVECLKSLEKLQYSAYKTVLVDNGSSNNEGTRLKDMFPNVYLIQNSENRGFAGGNNDGMNWALDNGFDYVVNLNNDCIVDKDWLSNFIKGLKSENADFASSRIMFYPDTDLICSDCDVMLPDGSAISVNRHKKYSGSGEITRIFSACGAGSVYSRECLEDVKIKNNQFFDELYFAYYEDVDLGIRLNTKSYKGVSIPDAVIYHKHSRTSGEYSRFKVFYSEKNRILNEILNCPVYLILVGEMFFVLRMLVLLTHPIFDRKSKGYLYLKNLGITSMILLILKARSWVVFNLFQILADRRERKAKGFINKRIYKFFCWNPRSLRK